MKICNQNACFQFKLEKYSSQISICLEGEKTLIVNVGSHNKYFCSVFELINLPLFSVKCKIRSTHILLIYIASFNLSLVVLSAKAFSAKDTSFTSWIIIQWNII